MRLLAAAEAGEPDDCGAARRAVFSGLALEEELGTAVQCSLWALRGDLDASGELLELVRNLHKTRGDWFYDIATGCSVCQTGDTLAKYGVTLTNGTALHLFVPDDAKRAELSQCGCHLGSGPYHGTCLPFFNGTGHYGVTYEAAGRITEPNKLSDAARELLADAAQDPDFFAWTTLRAHGQTEVDAGVPERKQTAQDNFVRFVRDNIAKSVLACSKRDIAGSLYWLGFALHSLQDFASHRGRTNPEHSYNAKEGKNPDEAELSTERASILTEDVLGEMFKDRLATCAADFSKFSGPQLSFREKTKRFNQTLDFTPYSVWEYKRSFKEFEDARQKLGAGTVVVRWFGETDDKGTSDDCRWFSPAQRATPCGALMARVFEKP